MKRFAFIICWIICCSPAHAQVGQILHAGNAFAPAPAISLAISGPASGAVTVASTNFTITLTGATFGGADTVTIADGSQNGTFTPSVGTCASLSTCTVTPAAAASSFTFTYKPLVTGAITLTVTNAQGWTNPSPATYTSSGYVGPGDVVASASGFWGLRAYNAAYAAPGTNKAANVCDTATLAVCTDVNILTTGAFDVATAAALTQCATSCSIKTLYDQTGGGHNVTHTVGIVPVLTFNCVNTSLPCMTFLGSSSQDLFVTGVTSAQPSSLSAVAIRTATFTAFNEIFSGSTGCEISFASTTGNAAIASSTAVPEAAANSVWHALNGVCSGSGNASALNVDGTDHTGLNTGTNSLNANWMIGARNTNTLFLTGQLTEVGLWNAVAFTSTQRGNMCHNQRLYWASSGAC